MKTFRCLLVVVILVIFQSKTVLMKKMPCSQTDLCSCIHSFDDEYELQCPPQDYSDLSAEGVVIHIKDAVEIDCYNMNQSLDANIIEPFNVSSFAKGLKIRYCPLPGTFSEVASKFNLEGTRELSFESTEAKNVVLNQKIFDGMSNLTYLGLSGNDLDLNKDVFENTPNLVYLEIGSNKINLNRELFKWTPLLEGLYISNNEFTSIPEGLLENLEHLRKLHLWKNNLTVLEDFYFRGLNNLKSLELSYNHIESVSSNAFNDLIQLEELNLSHNKIDNIPAGFFKNTKHLSLARLNSNPIMDLPDYLFANLSKLQTVSLSSCNLTHLPADTFNGCTGLKFLDLNDNKISHLNDGFLEKLLNLTELKLAGNRFEKIPRFIQNLKGLVTLDLRHNIIKSLQNSDFEGLSELEQISLQHNDIATIGMGAFSGCKSLKHLYLAHNSYNFEKLGFSSPFPVVKSPFTTCSALETLDLSFNNITVFHWEIFISNTGLENLNLRNNRIQNTIEFKDVFSTSTKTVTIRLDNNNITTVNFYDAEFVMRLQEKTYLGTLNKQHPVVVVHLDNNPINCDCNLYDFARYIHDQIDPYVLAAVDVKFENLKCQDSTEGTNIPIKHLPLKAFTCNLESIGYNATCPPNCICSLRPEDAAIVVDCSGRNLQVAPVINVSVDLSRIDRFKYYQTEIHLEDNHLMKAPTRQHLMVQNLTKLHLSNNNIVEMNWIPPNLETLRIDTNNLSRITFEVWKALNASSNLHHLSVHNNPWICDCDAYNFTDFLSNNLKKLDDNSPIRCSDSPDKLLTNISRTDLCEEWYMVYVSMAILIILLIVITCIALYLRYEIMIKVWLYSRNLCLWWVTEDELDKDKTYDVFVSFAQGDEDFVHQELLPTLETGRKPYKVCVHYRDWIPGEFIFKQVLDSVHASRRTLVVLSPNFLNSVWAKEEFRTAHTQAITDGRARLIVVLLGDLDTESLDDELRAYTKTNTYVKWGDPWFWDKLRYALPRSKQALRRNMQKHANIMRTIDDKMTLVIDDKKASEINPETTPPVERLDAASLLERNPLNVMKTPPAESPLVEEYFAEKHHVH